MELLASESGTPTYCIDATPNTGLSPATPTVSTNGYLSFQWDFTTSDGGSEANITATLNAKSVSSAGDPGAYAGATGSVEGKMEGKLTAPSDKIAATGPTASDLGNAGSWKRVATRQINIIVWQAVYYRIKIVNPSAPLSGNNSSSVSCTVGTSIELYETTLNYNVWDDPPLNPPVSVVGTKIDSISASKTLTMKAKENPPPPPP